MLTTIPFSGFYYSIHDDAGDYALDQLFQEPETGDPIQELVLEAFDRINWCVWFNLYAKGYCENMAEEFKVSMEFESLVSPREYNFTTDRIFATISVEEVKRLRSLVNEYGFRELARENFTSRSGFCSSYDSDVDEWGDIETWDHNQIGTLLHAYVKQESNREFDPDEEFQLMESDRDNGNFDRWLEQAIPNVGEMYAKLPVNN